MARSSHNGALVFGLVLGAAGGAAWAVWNAREPGRALQAKIRRSVDDALGRDSRNDARPLPPTMLEQAAPAIAPSEPIQPDGVRPLETASTAS